MPLAKTTDVRIRSAAIRWRIGCEDHGVSLHVVLARNIFKMLWIDTASVPALMMHVGVVDLAINNGEHETVGQQIRSLCVVPNGEDSVALDSMRADPLPATFLGDLDATVEAVKWVLLGPAKCVRE